MYYTVPGSWSEDEEWEKASISPTFQCTSSFEIVKKKAGPDQTKIASCWREVESISRKRRR